MRNLVIDSIIKLWETQGCDELARYLEWPWEEAKIFEKFEHTYKGEVAGTAGDLYKILIQLTDEDLLNILSSQHCLLYR
jgi:hypothetical protein